VAARSARERLEGDGVIVVNLVDCDEFYPLSGTYGEIVCYRCSAPLEAHPAKGDELDVVALRIFQLLTHYGHHCTVQTLLPDLRAALILAGVNP